MNFTMKMSEKNHLRIEEEMVKKNTIKRKKFKKEQKV